MQKNSEVINDLVAELDISIACMMDTATDDETEKDLKHIQDSFLKLIDLLNLGDTYVK